MMCSQCQAGVFDFMYNASVMIDGDAGEGGLVNERSDPYLGLFWSL